MLSSACVYQGDVEVFMRQQKEKGVGKTYAFCI